MTRESQADALKFDEDLSYAEWYHGPGTKAFAEAPTGRGPFWISRTPFPMNPAFDPPPPVSQRYKDALWQLHSKDPVTFNMRLLSERFGLTLERTHAVLRLKALEAEMTARVSSSFKCAATQDESCKPKIRLVLKTHQTRG